MTKLRSSLNTKYTLIYWLYGMSMVAYESAVG